METRKSEKNYADWCTLSTTISGKIATNTSTVYHYDQLLVGKYTDIIYESGRKNTTTISRQNYQWHAKTKRWIRKNYFAGHDDLPFFQDFPI
jgi:hypothetical protein